MEVVIIHWLIKKGKEDDFENRWKSMVVGEKEGLFREILTKVDHSSDDPKFHTFHLEDPNYTTYLNIGIWDSLESFDKAIGKYIPKQEEATEGDKTVFKIVLEEFEFKMRERICLKKVLDRGSKLNWPSPDLSN
ncbi:MAG: hypothetical protein RIF46_02045 [Cyclobacteriaceae bacterium]